MRRLFRKGMLALLVAAATGPALAQTAPAPAGPAGPDAAAPVVPRKPAVPHHSSGAEAGPARPERPNAAQPPAASLTHKPSTAKTVPSRTVAPGTPAPKGAAAEPRRVQPPVTTVRPAGSAETRPPVTKASGTEPAAPAASGPTAAAMPAPPADAVPVPAGKYYVGRATDPLDYRKLANASTPGFLVKRAPVTQGVYNELVAWGTLRGYAFDAGCGACAAPADDQPATGVPWRDAALFANALSEREGLDAVYRDAAGQPVREAGAIERAVVEPTLSGWRLPTIPEWQIALRGADKALAEGSYGGPARSPNALGLLGAAGPLAEWTATPAVLGGASAFYICNREADGFRRLSACVPLRPSAGAPDAGFRLVRRLGG